LLGHQLYGVDALDVKVYVVAALVLALASIASTYPAVLRARRLSPLVAIRAE
jgi:ABC-type lipoprotein release transport system permease subunit